MTREHSTGVIVPRHGHMTYSMKCIIYLKTFFTPKHRLDKLGIYSNDEPERVYQVLCLKRMGENQVQYQTIIIFYRMLNDPWYLALKIATFDY